MCIYGSLIASPFRVAVVVVVVVVATAGSTLALATTLLLTLPVRLAIRHRANTASSVIWNNAC